MLPTYRRDPIDHILANSYKDFHAKGLDYLCLRRSPKRTMKVYFLNGDVTKVPEVVNPHNHRYNFSTVCLAGSMVDWTYVRSSSERSGEVYQTFNYLTPLNGGNGFTFDKEERLTKWGRRSTKIHNILNTNASDIHTIQMLEDQTIIMIEQQEDIVEIGTPTQCWVRKGEPKPDTSGLYSKFTIDEVFDRIVVVEHLMKAAWVPQRVEDKD